MLNAALSCGITFRFGDNKNFSSPWLLRSDDILVSPYRDSFSFLFFTFRFCCNEVWNTCWKEVKTRQEWFSYHQSLTSQKESTWKGFDEKLLGRIKRDRLSGIKWKDRPQLYHQQANGCPETVESITICYRYIRRDVNGMLGTISSIGVG